MDVVQNIPLVFYNGNYFYLNKKFTSLSSSLAARSTLGFTCLTLLWNMNLTKMWGNMDLARNEIVKRFYMKDCGGEAGIGQGVGQVRHLWFSLKKKHWRLEVYCLSSTGNDWMPEGCRSSQQNRLFAKCYTTQNIFTKQRYCQWNISQLLSIGSQLPDCLAEGCHGSVCSPCNLIPQQWGRQRGYFVLHSATSVVQYFPCS